MLFGAALPIGCSEIIRRGWDLWVADCLLLF
jgi:hypothetical protein